MNNIAIDNHSMKNFIESYQEELERLMHNGEVVNAIPEINEMNPTVFLDRSSYKCRGDLWAVTYQFEKCYARIFDNGQILFVHFDDKHMRGRKEEFVTYYNDKQLVEEFKKHVDFLK